MVLVDTSVWVSHFKKVDSLLVHLLVNGEVACHPFVIGELACGRIKNRNEILSLLKALPVVQVAEHGEILQFIEANGLMGMGIGLVDVHLLASALLNGAPLWTYDKKLRSAASKLKVFYKQNLLR